MDTLSAFSRGTRTRLDPVRSFDWMKAVELIKKHNIKNANAGLESDYEWTAGQILADGKPVTNDYTYLASTWAIPMLIDLDDDTEYECWSYLKDTGYDSDTKWPEEAVKALTT